MVYIFYRNKWRYLLLVYNTVVQRWTLFCLQTSRSEWWLYCTLPPSCCGVARICATWLPCETTVTGVTIGVRPVWPPNGVTTCVIPVKQINCSFFLSSTYNQICIKSSSFFLIGWLGIGLMSPLFDEPSVKCATKKTKT